MSLFEKLNQKAFDLGLPVEPPPGDGEAGPCGGIGGRLGGALFSTGRSRQRRGGRHLISRLLAPESNFRSTPESGLKSDIAPCPRCANSRRRLAIR